MRVGVVADVHVGNLKKNGGPEVGGLNRRCREVVGALARAVRAAEEARCSRFVVAGDLVDYSDAEPQVLRAIADVLEGPMPTYLMLGNHDMRSEEPGDHALGPLGKLANITVVEKPMRVGLDAGEMALVPFRTGDARTWLPEALAQLWPPMPSEPGYARDDGGRLLVVHLGIVDDETPPWLRDAHDAVPLNQLAALHLTHGIGLTLAGNWHQHKSWKWGSAAAKVGALCPTGWSDAGREGYGSLIVYDERKDARRVEIPGPRFLVVKSRVEAEAARPSSPDESLYLRWDVDVAAGESLNEAAAYLGARTDLTAWDAAPEAGDLSGTARAAAASAAGKATGEQAQENALAAFVGSMVLPEGVERAAVLAEARRFLGGVS